MILLHVLISYVNSDLTDTLLCNHKGRKYKELKIKKFSITLCTLIFSSQVNVVITSSEKGSLICFIITFVTCFV